MNSLIDYFNELYCTFAIVMETWLSHGYLLEEDLKDLQNGSGLTMICKNREANARGVSHGGVCVLARDSRAKIVPLKLHN
jgi:hypothetical protein